MNRRLWIYFIVSLFLLGVGAGVGVLIYNAVVGGSAEPSISAEDQLATRTSQIAAQTLAADYGTQVAELQTEISVLNTAIAENTAQEAEAAVVVEATPEATETALDITPDATESTPEAAEAAAQSAPDSVTFAIVSAQSEARFNIDEDLFGQRVTVVGRTSEVAGTITVNFASPADSSVGLILVNARNLRTDNEFRNQALRAEILQSGREEYEFIEFLPTEISGLPASITIGEAFSFQISGDLTIRGATQPVTFDATVMPISETEISGSATTTVLYADFGLVIPSARGVSNVADEVILEIDFVAVPQG
jgi:polyisoprenoid-binding protein YceI